MAKFKKGESGNPNGRPPGQSQRVKELRNRIFELVEADFDMLQSEFQNLNGKDKFLILDKLLRHCMPSPEPINLLDGLTEDDLDKLISYVKDKNNHE